MPKVQNHKTLPKDLKKIWFNPNLPVTRKKDAIIDAIRKNKVVIISGETGSGKTTQIPKCCLAAGRGISKVIGCTQPRRIAAINVAKRIAHEMGESINQTIGYKIRFDDKTSAHCRVKIMTDGILLAETQTDRFLNAYDTMIVDEAHERSLNIDFTLGLLRRLIKNRRDLKLIITSATIDTKKFSTAFDNAPVIEVSGRMYPVETKYWPIITEDDTTGSIEDQGYVEAAANAVDTLISDSPKGDILVFMPTEQDITDTLEILKGKNHPGVLLLPLFARLSAKEQSRIFKPLTHRKIIVATNVAETSLTIPGIKYVVDTGLARVPAYSPRTRTTALPVSPISQSSANQRKGRCGRVENGICIRLYDEENFNNRPFFTLPEILRSNLAEVILRMMSLNLGDVSSFPFIDRPAPKSIKDGFDSLVEIGAVTKHKQQYRLTGMGHIMARLPIDPKLSRILLEADRQGCLKEALVIATALAISDPRQRPAEKQQAADQQHALFKDPASDFITLLNIWNAYKKSEKQLKSRSKLIKYCQSHFLSFKRLKEWNEIHRQVDRILNTHGIGKKKHKRPAAGARQGSKGMKSKSFEIGGPLYIALHKSLLSGYLAHIAHQKEKNLFNAAKGQQVMIFPGSGLFNHAGRWIMAAEFVKTSQLFARTAAKIDSQWIEEMGRSLCTYTYFDPHWEKKRGEVMALEQVSLFGLILSGDRKKAYGKINHEEAGEIFIRHALVRGEIHHPFDFMNHNQQLIDSLETLEHKQRRKDILASETDMLLFYRSRLPSHFSNIRTFGKFIKDQGNQDFLKMSLEDLQRTQLDDNIASLFPDTLQTDHGRYTLEYAFNPGTDKDGITIHLPAEAAQTISKHQIEHLVPGLFKDKIAGLIRALPKKYRKRLVPVTEKAQIIAREMPKQDRPLFSQLSFFIQKRFKIEIPATEWSDTELGDHLKMRISIRDKKNREITASRNHHILNQFSTAPSSPLDSGSEKFIRAYEKYGVEKWNFNDLETCITIPGTSSDGGFTQKYYPGLKIEQKQAGAPNAPAPPKQLNLKIFNSENQALECHKEGVCYLYQLTYPDVFSALKKDINRDQALKQCLSVLGNPTTLKASLFGLIVSTIFAKNLRTRDDFNRHGDKELKTLYHTGQKFIQTIAEIVKGFQDCCELIQKLTFQHANRKKTTRMLTHFLQELKNLIPSNFMKIYTFERIEQLHRYINCTLIRAQRAADNPVREEKKAVKLSKYSQQLDTVVTSLSENSTPEKSVQVEEFFWLLEEYKISVFAPEIKTRVKVSEKRLDQVLVKLSQMI